MNENKVIKFLILSYWTLFGGLTVIDKIVPDVFPFWVGVDFYTLLIKFFASLEITDPIFATIALAGISAIEVLIFVCYLFALIGLSRRKDKISEQWFYRGISLALLLFAVFSIGDQAFGARGDLLEHGIFWIMLITSWVVYKYLSLAPDRSMQMSFSGKGFKLALITGIVLTAITSYSILDFSKSTIANKISPVQGKEVVKGVYKFDFPFLGDKSTLENTVKTFEEKHPDLHVNYIYTGPDELNTKKKTHMLLYIFTEQKN